MGPGKRCLAVCGQAETCSAKTSHLAARDALQAVRAATTFGCKDLAVPPVGAIRAKAAPICSIKTSLAAPPVRAVKAGTCLACAGGAPAANATASHGAGRCALPRAEAHLQRFLQVPSRLESRL